MLLWRQAVRCGAPFIALVGNDAAWGAEYQIQLRDFGGDRERNDTAGIWAAFFQRCQQHARLLWTGLLGCELLPTRTDLVAAAMGCHGEHVPAPADRVDGVAREAIREALGRAEASGLPAVVDVAMSRQPAPTIRLPKPGL